MLTELPERPIDSVEKINEVIECVDTICPDSDDAYEWDSKVMRARHDEVVKLMYLAHNGNEWAVKEIESLRLTLSATRAERDEARRERDSVRKHYDRAIEELAAVGSTVRAETVEEAAKVADDVERRFRDVQSAALDRGANAGDLIILNAAQAKRTARDIAAAIRAILVQP